MGPRTKLCTFHFPLKIRYPCTSIQLVQISFRCRVKFYQRIMKRPFDPIPISIKTEFEASLNKGDSDGTEGIAFAASSSARREYPKRKVAMIMGYSGTGYQGMQRNPNAKTIESDLFEGLCRAGLVSKENSEDPKKIGWMRSCRTDKGVHAAGQVVSFKMLMKHGSDTDKSKIPTIIDELNNVLQNEMEIGKKMEIFGIIRTASSFHAKDRADSRYYEYLLPTFVFTRQGRDEFLKLAEASSIRTDVGGKPGKNDKIKISTSTSPRGANSESEGENEEIDPEETELGNKQLKIELTPEELKRISEYRVSAADLERFNSILSFYCGTHNFHNFTIGKAPTDPSAQRHIKTFTAGTPFIKVSEREDLEASLEWVAVRVHGLSFMMHQIRKMIGLAILAVRLDAYEPEHLTFIFNRLFSKTAKFNVPKAPALGLFLDHPLFEGYNRKFGKEENRELMEFEPLETRRNAFKNSVIYPEIFNGEFKTREFYNWLRCIDDHAYDFKYILKFE